MNLHKIINRIKEKKASKRFDVEIPEFNVKDCLKEEGIKIRVKNSEEKYLDVIFKVSTKFSSDPDGYGEDLESFAASFSYTAKNGYTFEKKADTFKKDKENYGFNSNLQANKIKRLLSEMARNDRITMKKPTVFVAAHYFAKKRYFKFNLIGLQNGRKKSLFFNKKAVR